jgi:hypothetical protein
MFLFYVDESGSPHHHAEPLLNGQTPIFVLASLVLHADRWRTIDRLYRELKVRFFEKEIGDRPPEQYEVKGSELVGPHNRTSRRRHAFVRCVMDLCLRNDARGFAIIIRKNALAPTPAISMYTMALQYLVERFNCFLEETTEGLTTGFGVQHSQGVLIADTRLNNLDLNVAVSHLSFVFGNPIGQRCLRVIEAPTFTFSQLSVGLQLTDIFAACIYATAYRRHSPDVQGGHDYSHMQYFSSYADRLEFKSQKLHDGYRIRGYRFIDFSVPA